jgi:hypothetical protein
MATSGHISAHRAQPVHCSGPEKTATVNPWLLAVGLMPTSFFGQAMVQSPHPLQRSSLIVIYDGMVSILFGQVQDTLHTRYAHPPSSRAESGIMTELTSIGCLHAADHYF